jgi:hypothetical protein
MSRRRYFEEQRSGNGAIYHCVKTEIEPGDRIRLFDLRYVFMFSNRYDGMRDLINNADEDVDCITSATESSIYHNDSFYIFV